MALVMTLSLCCVLITGSTLAAPEGASALQSLPYTIRKAVDKTYLDYYGQPIYHVFYERPFFEGDSTVAKQLNDMYSAKAEEFAVAYVFDSFEAFLHGRDVKEYTDMMRGGPLWDDGTLHISVECKIEYNRNSIISIQQYMSWDEGGGNCGDLPVNYTVDLQTGAQMLIADVLEGSKNDIASYVINVARQGDNWFSNSSDEFKTRSPLELWDEWENWDPWYGATDDDASAYRDFLPYSLPRDNKASKYYWCLSDYENAVLVGVRDELGYFYQDLVKIPFGSERVKLRIRQAPDQAMWEKAYASVLNEYKVYAEHCADGDLNSYFMRTESLRIEYGPDYGDDGSDLGYGFLDIDQNGTPELLLLRENRHILGIYSLVDGKPNELFCFGALHVSISIDEDGYVIEIDSNPEYDRHEIKRLNANKSDWIVIKAIESNDDLNAYWYIEGTSKSTTTKEEFERLASSEFISSHEEDKIAFFYIRDYSNNSRASYQPVINAYQSLVDASYQSFTRSGNPDIDNHIQYIIDNNYSTDVSLMSTKYAFYDIDKDGVDELIINVMLPYKWGNIYYIYTVHNGKLTFALDSSNLIFYDKLSAVSTDDFGMGISVNIYSTLKNGVFTTAESLTHETAAYHVGFEKFFVGEREVDKDEYEKVKEKYGTPVELDFIEITPKTTDTDYPIIVIPGIMGSRLFENGERPLHGWVTGITRKVTNQQVWPPLTTDSLGNDNPLPGILYHYGNQWSSLMQRDDLLVPGLSFTKPKARSIEPEDYNPDWELFFSTKDTREYGAFDTYKPIVDWLADEKFPNRDVFFFSYDWRQDIAKSADKLGYTIGEVLEICKASKVDIVAHSMGGLVASRFMTNENNRERVGKLITCGTPYEGAPELLNVVLSDEAVAAMKPDLLDAGSVRALGLTKQLRASLASMAELAPTENYIRNGPPFKQYSHTTYSDITGDHETTYEGYLFLNETKILHPVWNMQHHYDKINYAKYSDIMKIIFGDKYQTAKKAQESLNVGGFNLLTTLNNTYFIIGKNKATITALDFNDGNSLGSLDVDKIQRDGSWLDNFWIDDLTYNVRGDGTVPYLSATVMEKIKPWKDTRLLEVSQKHENTINSKKSMQWIYDILSGRPPSVKSDPDGNKWYMVPAAFCPVDMKIQRGNEVLEYSLANETYIPYSAFGRMDIIGKDNDIKMACIDDYDDYAITLTGTGTGTMDYELRFFDSNDNLQYTYSANDVPITPTTVITTGTNTRQQMALSIDENGDGKEDRVILLTRQTADAQTNNSATQPDDIVSNSPSNTSGNSSTATSSEGQTTTNPFFVTERGSGSGNKLPKTGQGVDKAVLFSLSLLLFCLSVCWLLCYRQAKKKDV